MTSINEGAKSEQSTWIENGACELRRLKDETSRHVESSKWYSTLQTNIVRLSLHKKKRKRKNMPQLTGKKISVFWVASENAIFR